MKPTYLSHSDVYKAAVGIAIKIQQMGLMRCYPIPRGGVPAAYAVKSVWGQMEIVSKPEDAEFYLDDLIDSGTTRARYADKPFFALYDKAQQFGHDAWLIFPWEETEDKSAEDIGLRLLQFIGEDVTREGLLDTPKRFVKAWREWTSGYGKDPDSLFTDFGDGAENYDEMVIIDPIPFYSHCEHHLAAIFGTVHLAYIPNKRIAGLSKFARLVDVFARRLQVQERLTTQICETIERNLSPIGVGVVVRARHFCMESRGAKTFGAETTTIALRGALKEEPDARAEFLSLIKAR